MQERPSRDKIFANLSATLNKYDWSPRVSDRVLNFLALEGGVFILTILLAIGISQDRQSSEISPTSSATALPPISATSTPLETRTENSATATQSATRTQTPTSTPSVSRTSTLTPTRSVTITPSLTPTRLPTQTPSATPRVNIESPKFATPGVNTNQRG